jgi:hypothetical protein
LLHLVYKSSFSLTALLGLNPMKFTLAALFCVSTACNLASAADGARLFGSSDLVPNASESATLTAEERKELAALRRHTNLHKSITVVRLNRAALNSGVVTVVTPEGKELQYVGALGKNYDQSFLWQGKSNHGNLDISYDEKALVGFLTDAGKMYQFRSLAGGRMYFISEAPIMALQESPGMSGMKDPPGLLPNIKPRPLPPQPASGSRP